MTSPAWSMRALVVLSVAPAWAVETASLSIDAVTRWSAALSLAWSAAIRSSRLRAAMPPAMSPAAMIAARTMPTSPNPSRAVPRRRRSTPSHSIAASYPPDARPGTLIPLQEDGRGADRVRRAGHDGGGHGREPAQGGVRAHRLEPDARAGRGPRRARGAGGRDAGRGRRPRRTSSCPACPTPPTSRPSCSARTAWPTASRAAGWSSTARRSRPARRPASRSGSPTPAWRSSTRRSRAARRARRTRRSRSWWAASPRRSSAPARSSRRWARP